jgi:hypothetical protein
MNLLHAMCFSKGTEEAAANEKMRYPLSPSNKIHRKTNKWMDSLFYEDN